MEKYPHYRVSKVTEDGKFKTTNFPSDALDRADASYRASCSDVGAIMVFLSRHKMTLDPKVLRTWKKGEPMPEKLHTQKKPNPTGGPLGY